MATNVIELLDLKTEDNIHYYRYNQYHGNDVNIRVEIDVHVKPYDTYSIAIYNLDEVDNDESTPYTVETLYESIEVSDSDILIKMIEILENKYKIKIINNKDYKILEKYKNAINEIFQPEEISIDAFEKEDNMTIFTHNIQFKYDKYLVSILICENPNITKSISVNVWINNHRAFGYITEGDSIESNLNEIKEKISFNEM